MIALLVSLIIGSTAQAQHLSVKTESGLDIALITGLPGCEVYDGTDSYFERCIGSIISIIRLENRPANQAKIEDLTAYFRTLGPLSKDRFARALFALVKNRPAKRSGGYDFNFDDIESIRSTFVPSTPAEEAAAKAKDEKSRQDLENSIR